ncbi:hypothetical protein TNCV_4221321 [Trichonephila clavipes]|nr:hypothetical protein TNCV_4221321 [Trichonephila clavipes]
MREPFHSSASPSIQDTKQKRITRLKKERKELIKKMNNTILEVKRKQHKPQEIASEQDSPDEDMFEYDPDEYNADEYIKKT